MATPEPHYIPGTATVLSYVVFLVFFVVYLGQHRRGAETAADWVVLLVILLASTNGTPTNYPYSRLAK